MRREAALAVGATGTLIVTVLQVILGQADITLIEQPLAAVGASLLPLIIGAATRPLVYAADTVERIEAEAVDLGAGVIGRDLSVQILRAAKDRGVGVVEAAIAEAVAGIEAR